MSTKLYDLAVCTGNFNNKAIWENVGSMYQSENGKKFISLKRTFSPAGLPVNEGNNSVVFVSCFEPKKESSNKWN